MNENFSDNIVPEESRLHSRYVATVLSSASVMMIGTSDERPNLSYSSDFNGT